MCLEDETFNGWDQPLRGRRIRIGVRAQVMDWIAGEDDPSDIRLRKHVPFEALRRRFFSTVHEKAVPADLIAILRYRQ